MKPAPRTLGRYALIRRIAQGGMGEVFLAEAQGAANFTKRVAIKRILPHLARNEDFVRKFIDEANVMVQLHHGNIVPVIELVEQDSELFLVMEYLPGRDLKGILRRARQNQHPFPIDLALWVVAEVCAGLDYAHRKTGPDGRPLHIIHRDVSPSNVVLGAGGEVKLLDFGIARARGGLHQSISGMLQGKFVYMSPEQADGRRIDPRSDVFSAGLVLYELVTGVRPLEGESETETLRLVRECRVPAPSTHRAEVPPAVDALVMRAVAPDPEARFSSAGELRRELLQLLAGARSTADAEALSRYLAGLFPEGVVPPDAPEGPLSLEDALEMQLGALTPGRDALGHTRTLTGPSGEAQVSGPSVESRTPSRPSVPRGTPSNPMRRASDRGLGESGPYPSARGPGESGPYPSARGPGESGPYPSGSYPGPSMPPGVHAGAFPEGTGPMPALGGETPRRRSPMVAVVMAAIAVGATSVAAWALWPRTAVVVPVVRPADATGVFYVVDGKRWKGVMHLPVGEHEVCVEAQGFVRHCATVWAARGETRLEFDLVAAPVLEPSVTPAGARLLLDGRPVAGAPPLEAGRSYELCAEAAGHERGCATFVAAAGRNAPALALAPVAAPDAGPPPARADAGVEPPRPDTPPRPRHRTVQVRVSPPEATLLDDETNQRLPGGALTLAGDQRRRVRVEAPGYRAVTVPVGPDSSAQIEVRLERVALGQLNARVLPGNARLYLDGREITNPTRGLELPTGRYQLTGVWLDGVKERKSTKDVTISAGETATAVLELAPQEVP